MRRFRGRKWKKQYNFIKISKNIKEIKIGILKRLLCYEHTKQRVEIHISSAFWHSADTKHVVLLVKTEKHILGKA